MKTRQQVVDDIEILMKIGKETRDTSEKSRIRKRLQFLRPIAMYMESNPTEQSVKSQLQNCIKRVEVVERDFDSAFPAGCDTRTKSEFMKGKGLPELKKQVKVLQYLLESK
jgi:BMFP domain-containing protein YqiC